LDFLGPEALEVGGEAAGARRGDEQVAAEIEEEGGEAGVGGAGGEGGEAGGGGEGRGGGGGGAEAEGDAVEVALVVSEVGGAEGGEVFSGGAREIVIGGGGGVVVAAVGEGADVGDGGDEENDLGGVANLQRGGGRGEIAAGHEGAEASGVADTGVGAVGGIFSVGELAGHEEAVRAFGSGGEALGAVEGDVEVEGAGLGSGEANDDSVVGRADENFAGVGDFAEAVGEARDGGFEVELAAVVGGLRVGGNVEEFESEVAEGLVGTVLGVGATGAVGAGAGAGEVFVHEGFGLGVLAFEEQAADLGERLGGVGAVGVLG
jgi:hypothetical protein